MRAITCHTARLWLQAPVDLQPDDRAALNAHILECAACYGARKRYKEVDRLLQQSLAVVAPAGSVHHHVRERLEASRRARTGPARRGLRLLRRPAPHGTHRVSILIESAIAAVVVAVLLLASQFVPTGHPGPQTIAAAWRLVRADIGYPVAADPSRSGHLLAGAWGQVYESWDAGGSWRPLAALPPHLVIRDLAIDSSQPTRYLVAVKNSIFVSRDAGRRWTRTAGSMPGAENIFLMQDPVSPRTFFVGPSALWKSVDHGEHWFLAGHSTIFAPDGIQSVAVAPGGDLYTGIWGGGVALSRDGGRSWVRRSRDLRRNVMDVTVSPRGTLWAATDRGLYVSTDQGLRWRRSGLPDRFWNTSVLARGGYLLAGGNGGLYRSTDGGRHWHLSMAGLPLDPYIYGLIPDPRRPGRVYASLNSDGPFRSDDGGRHWIAIDSGLPVRATGGATHLILFRRNGALWHTDSDGSDPGVLTVERDVRMAALSPDGAAVAYVAAGSDGWGVRVLSAGGSAAHTILTGRGARPRHLLWSPTSSLLAIVGTSTLTISDLSHVTRSWSVPSTDRLVGWSAGGQDLLFWGQSSGRHAMVSRAWATGETTPWWGADFPVAPLPAPDGRQIALISGGSLELGTWRGRVQAVTPVRPGCRLLAWSDDSS
ncbi:MAG: hypothetical protein JOZ41_06870, partial [Chloroflexi bacterium]|nr:hypothetical protein [Chloroflexota bacterium]